MIDLRSDTCSRPTRAMLEAMARAQVGDDVYGDDPTVRALEERVADILGHEDAVYMVTGTMTNQVALRAHAEPGDTVLMSENAHVHVSESGAPAALSGVTVRDIPSPRGQFSTESLEAALPTPHPFAPETLRSPPRLVCVENTHNFAGGTVWPLHGVEAVTHAARRAGLATHLDGARLWNACARSGHEPVDYARHFDSVSVCFSKGLGAPIGSALAGSHAFVRRARRFKQVFGGGFRQAGVIAAGALFALEHHRGRLVDDHARAARFAAALAASGGFDIDLEAVETNIVRFGLTDMPAAEFVEACHARGVHMLPNGPRGVRAVFHLDVSESDTDLAIEVATELVSRPRTPVEPRT